MKKFRVAALDEGRGRCTLDEVHRTLCARWVCGRKFCRRPGLWHLCTRLSPNLVRFGQERPNLAFLRPLRDTAFEDKQGSSCKSNELVICLRYSGYITLQHIITILTYYNAKREKYIFLLVLVAHLDCDKIGSADKVCGKSHLMTQLKQKNF